MKNRQALVIWVVAGILALFFSFGSSFAGDYPEKPVQAIVGFPPGGPADISIRALAEAVKPYFPQPITVVNKPGGGSVLATNEVVKAEPDGYTLGQLDISALAVSPHLTTGLPYKGPDNIEPIISVATAKCIFAVRADAPWKTMKEVIDYAKTNPDQLRIGNAGIGTTTHIHFMSLKLLGVPMSQVPFTGAAPAVTALLGGHIEGIVMNITPVLPHVKAGKLKYLALFTEKRMPQVPELDGVPTLKELGYNAITEGTSYFLAAPKGTPPQKINMLYEAFLKAEKSDYYQKFADTNVLSLEYKGPAELKKELQQSYVFYTDFLKKAGLLEQK